MAQKTLYAALNDEEGCLEKARQRGIIIPEEGSWKERWDLCVLVLILYSAAIVPFRVCFGDEARGVIWVIEASMSIGFLMDVAFSFRTAYFENGEWVVDPMAISRRYLFGWFWIDA
jgi:hypothetical protein